MSEVEQAPKKKSNHFNDNCQNCVKQRKQNESFIKIYQKLQLISQKTSHIKQKVNQHQLSSNTNRSFYKTFQDKIVHIPQAKKQVNSSLLQSAGFELAIGIIEKDQKKKLVEENERLKQIINQMRNQKWQQQEDSLDMIKSSCFTEKKNFSPLSTSIDKAYNSCQTPKPRLSDTQALESILLSNDSQQNYEQNTTQSSSFQPKSSKNMSRYSDLNLWLYQQQKNAKLQQQLFLPQKTSIPDKSFMPQKQKGRSFVSKMATRGLSSLRKK